MDDVCARLEVVVVSLGCPILTQIVMGQHHGSDLQSVVRTPTRNIFSRAYPFTEGCEFPNEEYFQPFVSDLQRVVRPPRRNIFNHSYPIYRGL